MIWFFCATVALFLVAALIAFLQRKPAAGPGAEPIVQGLPALFDASAPPVAAPRDTRPELLMTAPSPVAAAPRPAPAPPVPPAASSPVPPPPAPAPAPAASAQAAPATPATPATPEAIEVEGRTVSPRQYRWLFPDLATLQDDAALHHYRHSGRDELARKARFAPPDRLREVELQRLSPADPEAVPSPYWRYNPGTSGTLNIICSHIAPHGQFGPTIAQTGSPDAQLYIRPEAHEFFQRGVPGLSTNVEETARWLEAVVARIRPTRIRTVGFSAGAYGALLFGHLLSADAITAVAGDFVLGRPQYRSWLWYPAREYHPVYRDLRPFLPAMAPRLALLYPAYDPMEFRAIQEARAAGLTNMAMTCDLHPAENAVAMKAIVAGPETLVPLERINPRPYAQYFEDATVEQLATAYEALAEKDYTLSTGLMRTVLEAHPRNHGLSFHIGIQQALLGDVEGGEHMIDATREALRREFPDGYGERLGRFGRTLVRNFYRPEPTLLRRLEARFDAEGAAAG